MGRQYRIREFMLFLSVFYHSEKKVFWGGDIRVAETAQFLPFFESRFITHPERGNMIMQSVQQIMTHPVNTLLTIFWHVETRRNRVTSENTTFIEKKNLSRKKTYKKTFLFSQISTFSSKFCRKTIHLWNRLWNRFTSLKKVKPPLPAEQTWIRLPDRTRFLTRFFFRDFS